MNITPNTRVLVVTTQQDGSPDSFEAVYVGLDKPRGNFPATKAILRTESGTRFTVPRNRVFSLDDGKAEVSRLAAENESRKLAVAQEARDLREKGSDNFNFRNRLQRGFRTLTGTTLMLVGWDVKAGTFDLRLTRDELEAMSGFLATYRNQHR